MARRVTVLLLAAALAGCGTTAEERARILATPTPQATPTTAPSTPSPAGPVIDAESAGALAEAARLRGGEAPVTGVAWRPDGAALITGDEAGVVRRFPAEGGEAAVLGDDGDPIRGVTATGDRIAWGGEAGVVRAVGGSAGGGAARDVAEAARGVFSLSSTPAGVLAAGSGEGTVLVFGRRRYTLEGLGRAVDGVAFATNGRLAAISRTGDGAVWDGPDEVARFGYADGERGGEMHAVGWLDADRVGTVSEDGALRAWPAAGGERLERVELSGRALRALAIAPGGAVVAVAGDEGTVSLLDPDLERVGRVRIGSPVSDLAFSPDGSRLAVAAADGSVRVLGLR